MKKVIVSQFWVLLIGTLFAWGNFGYELYVWMENNGSSVSCIPGITNPFLTPCFYGAIFFTIAFVLSVVSLKKINKNNF